MNRKFIYLIGITLLAAGAFTACGVPDTPTVRVDPNTATSIPSVTPTATRQPTRTPDFASTEAVQAFQLTLQAKGTQGVSALDEVVEVIDIELPALTFATVRDGSPVPVAEQMISPANATAVTQLARWGRGFVRHVTYSSGGRLMAVGTSSGVYVHDMLALEDKLSIDTVAAVRQVFFSPDTEILGAVLTNGHVRIWDVESGELVEMIEDMYVVQAIYTPEGDLLVAEPIDSDEWGRDPKITNYTNGEILIGGGDIDNVPAWANSPFIFSPNSSMIFVEKNNGFVTLSVNNGDELFVLESAESGESEGGYEYGCGGVTTATVSADSNYFAYACWELGKVDVFNLADGTIASTIEDVPWDAQSIALSSDGSLIAIESAIFRVNNGQLLTDVGTSFGNTISMAFSRNDLRLVVGNANGQVALIRTANGTLDTLLHDYAPNGYGIGIDPNSKFIVHSTTAGAQIRDFSDGIAYLNLEARANRYKLKSRSSTAFRSGPQDTMSHMAISTDANRIAVAYDTGYMVVWSTDTGRVLAESGLGWDWWRFEFTPDNNYLYSTVVLFRWDIAINEISDKLLNSKYIIVLDIASDGQLLAFSQIDSGVKVISLPDHTDVSYINLKDVQAIKFSPDTKNLALAQGDNVHVYDTETQQLEFNLVGHTDQISIITYSPDGSIIATGSDNGELFLWDAQGGTLLHILRGHTAWVTDITFSSDGKYLLTASNDGTLSIWGIAP